MLFLILIIDINSSNIGLFDIYLLSFVLTYSNSRSLKYYYLEYNKYVIDIDNVYDVNKWIYYKNKLEFLSTNNKAINNKNNYFISYKNKYLKHRHILDNNTLIYIKENIKISTAQLILSSIFIYYIAFKNKLCIFVLFELLKNLNIATNDIMIKFIVYKILFLLSNCFLLINANNYLYNFANIFFNTKKISYENCFIYKKIYIYFFIGLVNLILDSYLFNFNFFFTVVIYFMIIVFFIFIIKYTIFFILIILYVSIESYMIKFSRYFFFSIYDNNLNNLLNKIYSLEYLTNSCKITSILIIAIFLYNQSYYANIYNKIYLNIFLIKVFIDIIMFLIYLNVLNNLLLDNVNEIINFKYTFSYEYYLISNIKILIIKKIISYLVVLFFIEFKLYNEDILNIINIYNFNKESSPLKNFKEINKSSYYIKIFIINYFNNFFKIIDYSLNKNIKKSYEQIEALCIIISIFLIFVLINYFLM